MKKARPYIEYLFDQKNRRMVLVFTLLIVMLISFFGLANLTKVDDLNTGKVMARIEKSRKNVENSTLIAATVATGLALVPDDSTTPVADQILKTVGSLMGVSIVLMLEEIIVRVAPVVCFRWMIPIACLLVLLSLFNNSRFLKQMAVRLIALGLCLFFVVPAGVFIEHQVDIVIGTEEKLAMVRNISQFFTGGAIASDELSENNQVAGDDPKDLETIDEDPNAPLMEKTINTNQSTDNDSGAQTFGEWMGNVWSGTTGWIIGAAEDVGNLFSGAAEDVGNAVSGFFASTTELLGKAKEFYSNLLGLVVAMIITDCVIPVCMFFFLIWFIKMLFESLIMPDYSKKGKSEKQNR